MKKLIFITLISLMTISCTKDNEVNHNLLYYNTFESHEMIIDWDNAWLCSDGFNGGSDSCLVVSGGCIIHPTQYSFGPVKNTIMFGIRFWAKTRGSHGGSLSISTDTVGYSYCFYIENPEWKLYETDTVLICPANGMIRLCLIAGGITGGTILVDNLEIFRKH